MNSFTIDEKEYPIVAPKGRKGRRATAFILGKFGEEGNVTDRDIFALFGSDEFEDHLPDLLGVPSEILDESGDTGEIMNALFACIEQIYESLSKENIATALKNSEGTPEEEGEE
jgi:hypothetical protein